MTLTMPRTDFDIQTAVQRELKWDSQVEDTHVSIKVDKGVVMLTGVVSSYAEKIAAQDAAHRIKGVLDVVNDIEVKIPELQMCSDIEIAQAVRRALEWDPLIAAEKIQATISNGWVTLEGSVPFWADRSHAEMVVRNLIGVRGVTNNLAIGDTTVAPETVRHAVEEALERRADQEAARIQVAVINGTVYLTGHVRSWNEKQAVLGAVGHAPGVQRIEDRLYIDPRF